MNVASEKVDRWILMSALLHIAFFTALALSPFFSHTVQWGSANGGEGIKVNLVGSMAGIALPAPDNIQENAQTNESKGLYQTEPAPPAAPAPDTSAVKIPEMKAPVKASPAPKPPTAQPKKTAETPPPPENAVPYGGGGRPAIGYGQFQTGVGTMGIGFGEGAFGTEFGPYVQAMQRKISQNWLQGMIDSSVTHAPRVSVTFDILRDGTITNFVLKQSSNIPSLDHSAERAIRASSPLQPLPAGYPGSKVSVYFYFDYVR